MAKIKGSLLDKNGYCNYDTFIDADIDLYFIMGHRWDGKTYGALKLVLDEYFNTGTPSAYVRRLDDSLLPSEAGDLLDPFEISLTSYTKNDNTYNAFNYRSHKFYPVKNDGGKIVMRGKPVLYTASLNTWQNSKGADRGQVRYIILDEAIDDRQYLKNEVKAWKNTMSTFLRHYGRTTIIILANPLNPYCPYFEHYGIHMEKMKQGEISDIVYDDGQTMRFVWLPKSANKKRNKINSLLNAGTTNASITQGAWDVGVYRTFESDVVKACERLYQFEIVFSRMNYVVTAYYTECMPIDIEMQLTGVFYTIEKCGQSSNSVMGESELIITDRSVSSITKSNEKYDFFHMNPITTDLIESFKTNRVYYDSNTTGAAIEQWLKVVVSKRGSVHP